MPRSMSCPESFLSDSYAQQRFKEICQWAKDNHPYYQRSLADCDQVPILTREQILDNNQMLLNGHEVTGKTSGSTGVPVQISWSQQRHELEGKVTNKFVGWLGGRRNVTKMIHLGEKDQGDQFLDVNSAVDVQLEYLQKRYAEQGADAITTYPTNAERLCLAILERKLDMSFVQRVGCYAEVFEPNHERLIQQAFPNAQIWTTYSSTEFGMIAARCPHNPDFHHVFAGKLGVEILNKDGKPCEKNELGRLVITDYFNTHMPLIRYEIGDLAAWGECDCGKIPLPAFSRVVGKVRGALVHRNGERVPFTNLSVALREIKGMRQYQVIQHELERFELRYVTSDEYDEALRHAAVVEFSQHFGYQPQIEFRREKVIERGANGKYYASISHV
ncbi:MAG: hypothetical protein CL693_05760 [Cellvibrionaceae bacterium]|nr:hypothetical protein [Cellvibrionaceae bacterium]